MKKKIAIEPSLSRIGNYLSNKGYEVESVNYGIDSVNYNANEYAAVIISGQSKDFMGMQDILTESMVIDADGMSAQEVYDELQNRLH